MDKDDAGARREKWARLRFAVVGPLLASPPPAGQLGAEFERLSQRDWEHPSGKGPVRFAASTIERWYYRARAETFLQQGRQGGEHAAEADTAGGGGELRFDRPRLSTTGQNPSRNIASRTPHRRLPVPPIARAAIRLRLRFQPRRRLRPRGTGTLFIDTAFRSRTRVRRRSQR